MANQITRNTFWEETHIGHLNERIWMEGRKAYGEATNDSITNDLFCTSLNGGAATGNVEENIKASGTQGTITGWQAAHLYELGEVCETVVGNSSAWHRVTAIAGANQTGLSGAVEPAWSGSRGATIGDNVLTWRNFDNSPIQIYQNAGGSSWRNALVDDTKDFRIDITQGMVTVNTTTNSVESYSDRGCFSKHTCWDNGDIPDGEGYEVHGFEKDVGEVTDFMKVFQGNTIVVYDGTGKGAVRRIKTVYDDGTNVHFIPYFPFSEAMDSTSKFYICWSPMDIIYKGDASGWDCGDLVFTPDGHKLIAVRMKDHILEIGNNGTDTYFGWAGYVFSYQVPHGGVNGWGGPASTRNVEAKCFFGEMDLGDYDVGTDTPAKRGEDAIFQGGNTWAWAGAAFSTEANTEGFRSGSIDLGATVFSGSNLYALFTNTASGKIFSYHNVQLDSVPGTTNTVGDYIWYGGAGFWQGPFWDFTSLYNVIVDGIKGEWVAKAGAGGCGWFFGNTGDHGDMWTEHRNTNIGIATWPYEADDVICDWWQIAMWAGYDCWFYEKKSLAINILDTKTKLPIQDANITITDFRETQICYYDSEADLTADVTAVAGTITVDLREKFTTGLILRINNEYMLVGTVTGSPTGAGTVPIAARATLYPSRYRATIHKYDTVSFDKNIYIVAPSASDANGEILLQYITFFSFVAGGASGDHKHEVLVDGVNWTCKLAHQASAANDPPNATYWEQTGSEGFKWKENAYYTAGENAKSSWTEHGPFIIKVTKAGYEPFSASFAPTVDSEHKALTVELIRSPIYIDQEQVFS